MDNDNIQPVFTVGTLPKKCYTDPQELLNDFARALSVPQDNAKVIQGAIGPQGPPGNAGPPGQPGPAGVPITKVIKNFPIPVDVASITIPIFDAWQTAAWSVLYNGVAGHPTDPDFADLDVVIGVGTIVPVYSAGATVELMVTFIFQGTPTLTPDDKFILSATTIQ